MRHARADLDRASRCTHTHVNGSWITWYDATGTPTDEPHGVSRRCLYCGEWRSLGEANDRGVPEREMQLARDIANGHRGDLVFDHRVSMHVELDGFDRWIREQCNHRRRP